MTIGERIRTLRLQMNMSQGELGAKVGLQKAAINKYETGVVVNLKPEKVVALASALNTTPAYIMGWEDTSTYHCQRLPCGLNDTVYIVHRFLTIPPVIEPIQYRKLLAVIDTLPFGHNEAYLTEEEAKAAL